MNDNDLWGGLQLKWPELTDREKHLAQELAYEKKNKLAKIKFDDFKTKSSQRIPIEHFSFLTCEKF